MFDKLLSILPYNPSVIHQLAFYSKRIRAEKSVRRVGMIFIVLAFLVQFFAVISPPQSSSADSSNDLINGGFNSAAQAANDCRSNLEGYGSILANYGITCDRVAAANTININASDFNRQLFSMGHNNYNIAGETPVNINGNTLFVRYLWGWGNANYNALNVTAPGGQTFLLLYNCGNLTSVGIPVPVAPPKPPALTISKTSSPNWPVAGSSVPPGTILSWRVVINNLGGSAATNVVLKDPTPANTTFNWVGSGAASTYNYVPAQKATVWTYPSLPAGTTNDYVDVGYKVNANTPNGTRICNTASVGSDQTAPVSSAPPVCFTVVVKAPAPKPTPIPTPPPSKPTPKPTPPKVCMYDTAILATNSKCVVCKYNQTIIASSPQCKPCTASINSTDTLACVSVHKTASNLTSGVSDANNTTAQPNDSILYTLYAQNSGKATVKGFVFQENINDVLDYATITDLHGGKINSSGVITWPAIDIPAQATVKEQVTVKVKSIIPSTPVSSSDPEHFNLVMTNVYGNTINIKVPPTPAKTIEMTAAVLPNTGPGTSLFVIAAVVIIAGYFLARARILSVESEMAIRDSINGGL